MKSQPKVSFIIITLNRGEVLVNTLKDVLKQDYPDYEIIVVDQSDKPNPALEAFLKDHKNKLQYLKVDWKDQPRARNLGAETATGEILLYTDDDISVQSDFIQHHVTAYAHDSAIGGVTGAVITPHDSSPIGGSYVTGLGKIILNREARTAGFVDIAFGCNMSFRRDVWKAVGGFDPVVKSNNLEEAFICMQMKEAGYKIYYTPQAVTLHFVNPTGGTRNYQQRIEWYYPWFFNQFYFFLRFFPRALFPLFVLSKWRPLVSCMFYYGKGRPRALITPWRALGDAYQSAKQKERT